MLRLSNETDNNFFQFISNDDLQMFMRESACGYISHSMEWSKAVLFMFYIFHLNISFQLKLCKAEQEYTDVFFFVFFAVDKKNENVSLKYVSLVMIHWTKFGKNRLKEWINRKNFAKMDGRCIRKIVDYIRKAEFLVQKPI